jgi:nucleoside-diphosphate-sugar epimerase
VNGYQNSEYIRIINLKVAHMYGPNDDDETKFIPWLIKQFQQNQEQIKLTEGRQKRDFVYVTDVVMAYLKLLEYRNNLSGFIEYDIGTGQVVSLYEFVSELYSQYKKNYPESRTLLKFGSVPYHEGELMQVTSDTSQIRAIGWTPEYTFREGIKTLIPPRTHGDCLALV